DVAEIEPTMADVDRDPDERVVEAGVDDLAGADDADGAMGQVGGDRLGGTADAVAVQQEGRSAAHPDRVVDGVGLDRAVEVAPEGPDLPVGNLLAAGVDVDLRPGGGRRDERAERRAGDPRSG